VGVAIRADPRRKKQPIAIDKPGLSNQPAPLVASLQCR
jgi:hypothetical protein